MYPNNKSKFLYTVCGIFAILIILFGCHLVFVHKTSQQMAAEKASTSSVSKVKAITKHSSSTKKSVSDNQSATVKATPSYMNYQGKRVINWNKPTGAHPNLANTPASALRIVVNQSAQRVNIYKNNTLVSQLVCSTGLKKTPTPNGNFAIQKEHGNWFYNGKADTQEGAKNWISWKDHGVYLFHSVPCNKNQQFISSKMGKLGQPNSHGCVQLSVPDSQWICQTFSQPNKLGTKVIVTGQIK